MAGGLPENKQAAPAVVCSLDGQAASAATARSFSSAVLAEWGLAELSGDVQLVVSELVTNACRYAVPSDASLPSIEVSLERHASHVACLVSDASPQAPCPAEVDDQSESGRGLHLVASFSRDWGWGPRGGWGKVVWATFAAPAPM